MGPRSVERIESANETTPLLGASETVVPSEQQNGDPTTYHANGKALDTSEQNAPQEGEKPMPYLQIMLLCYASLGEPVAFFSIFPFVNEMIQRNGHLDEKNVGFWAGMIVSKYG